MNIGIISDTHDDLLTVKSAIKIFNENKVSYVIHAGDYVFPGVVKEFKHLNGKLIGVLGNNDGEKLGLLKNFQGIGGELYGEFCDLELDNFKIAVYHGTSDKMTEAIISSRQYNLVIHGHTHKKREDKIHDVLVLNPGCAHREFPNIEGEIETEPSIIIFDSTKISYKFIRL
ncbi:MAG TPA: metallophosphoesterase [Nitrososphaeraceae archaeon]|nr:metallophosphoesterase [Nitrososphaeraceae archaeon]